MEVHCNYEAPCGNEIVQLSTFSFFFYIPLFIFLTEHLFKQKVFLFDFNKFDDMCLIIYVLHSKLQI
jgi:hypothetical protein